MQTLTSKPPQESKGRHPERRLCSRTPCRVPVKVRVPSTGWSDSFLLDARDFSSSGIFLQSELLFPLGQELEVEFVSASHSPPLIHRAGRVVRVVGNTLHTKAGFVVGKFGLTRASHDPTVRSV